MTQHPRRAALASVAAAAVAALAAPTAHAGEPALAYGDVLATYPTATSVKVCASGPVDDGGTGVGQWLVTGSGARPTGTAVALEPLTAARGAFPLTCRTFALGASGEVVGHLTFVGAGTSDVTGAWGVSVTWTPDTGPMRTHYYTNP